MTRLRAWCCTVLLSLFSGLSQAQLQLELDTSGLNEVQQAASQHLLEQALSILPPSFIERINQRVSVSWQSDLPEHVYGQVARSSGIELNADLLAALVDGSALTDDNGRHHGNLHRELVATLVHELLHLYDRARIWPAPQRRLQQRCQQHARTLGDAGLPEQCRGQTARRFSLSDDPRFLDLAGWQQRVGQRGLREKRNDHIARSPDTYELTSPQEYAAVNFEYFLLDPSYACRRPSIARFLSEHFAWSPSSEPCPTDYAYLNAGRDFASQPLGRLDPAQVYEVDYLLADANEEWMSRWGHSMLRLVICAPGRTRGPDCRLDLEHHLVLSYRAFVGDVQLSSWDGLTGAYPSRLFILPLEQVIDEYTKVELRSLSSVPLKLSREQVEHLVARAAEQHWSYDGSYYFVSNNCAVETLKLLRSGSNDPRLQTLDSMLPNGLLRLLAARDLAQLDVLDDVQQARRLGYHFDSFRQRYTAMFEVARQRLNIPERSVEQWLALPAASRRPWFAQADLRASAALLLLEQAALRQQLLLAQDELKRRYLTARDVGDRSVDKAGQTLEHILANSGFLSRPAELLEAGYGLPQPSEWQHLLHNSTARQQQLRQLSDELDQEVRSLLDPTRQTELSAAEENLQELSAHLRALHQASGGLQLP